MPLIKALCLPWAYVVAAAFLAALIAYPLLGLFEEPDVSLLRSLVSRIGQAFLLFGLWPIHRALGLCGRDFGLAPPGVRLFFLGFALGLLTLSLQGGLLVGLGIRHWAPPIAGVRFYLQGLGSAALTGMAVALLEESLFRGALLAILLKWTSARVAILISAFDYAALHFISSHWVSASGTLGWDSGFRIALDGFLELAKADPSSFLALFAAGLFLGQVRLSLPGGLLAVIGIHAGWVLIVRLIKSLTRVNDESGLLMLIGHYDQVIGLISLIWLLPLVLLGTPRRLGARFP